MEMKVELAEPEIELSNPPNRSFLIVDMAQSMIIFFIGILMLPGEGFKIIVPMMMFSFSAIILLLTSYRQIIHRPKSITVKNDGVLLKFRITRPILLGWEDVMYIVDSNPSRIFHWGEDDGALKPINGYFYSVTFKAASEIKKAYHERTGRYPMTRDEYLRTKKR